MTILNLKDYVLIKISNNTMERSRKIILSLFIPIVIGTAAIIGLVAPAAYHDLCEQKANEISNRIYGMEGGKEEFLRSLNYQNFSSEVNKELQNLNMVLTQCPELGTLSISDSQFYFRDQEAIDNSSINQV
ncbi:MAG TPA: hypothetical protein VD815_07825 [Candidatus Saccharimonadales bacterium]|nr:hypothetical protein [Candidatus Saccharimonadales bacterium]